MHERSIGTEHAGPGNRPNRPARLTRKLTLQDSPLQPTWGEHSEHPPIASEDAPSPATRSLHNIPWCGLRSRLGAVRLLPPGSDSTRHSNHQPSDGWQVRSERADLWQVFSRPIDPWQVHRRPAAALSCSGSCPHLAAVCLCVAAAWMQTAAVWLCLSAAAACLSPAAALHHAATASLLRPLLPPLVQLLPLPALDAQARGTAVARDTGLLRDLKLREVHSARAAAAVHARAVVDDAYFSTAPSRGREVQSTRMATLVWPLSDVDYAFLSITLFPPLSLPPLPPLLSPLPLCLPPQPLPLLSPPLSSSTLLPLLLPSPFPFPSPSLSSLPPISPLTPPLVEASAVNEARRCCLFPVGCGLPLLEPSPRPEARTSVGSAERRAAISCHSHPPFLPPGPEKGTQSPLSTSGGKLTHTQSPLAPTPPHPTLHSRHHSSCRPWETPGTLPRKRLLPRAGVRSAPPHPLTSLCTLTITPPAAIVKPQGFFVRSFPPRGAAGVHIHLTLSHASYHLLTCPIVHWRRRTPAAYHHRRRRRHQCRQDGAYDPLRHRQHRHAAGVALMSRWTLDLTSPLGAAAEGDVGYRTAQPPPSHPPSPSRLTNLSHTIHALTIHGPSPQGGQALPDHGIPKPHLIS